MFLASLIYKSYVIDNLEIYFLDVGQGDGILIITPDKQRILIDGGPDSEILSQLPKVSSYFYKDIDLIVLSHPDADHIGGLPEVLNYFNVSNIMYTKIDHQNSFYAQFKAMIEDKDINVINIYDQKYFRIGCCTYINILWPLDELSTSALKPNDTSISFELIYKDTNFFFGGDISDFIEDEIINNDPWLDVDLLKVSHHGSRSSSSANFVNRISPQVAVIQVGRDNKFKHPHQEVLNVFEEEDIPVLRTDQRGIIKVSSDGKEINY